MGYRIKEIRESLNMTQDELARRSGVSRGTIAALESNRETTTTTKTLSKIAKAFGVSISQIFFDYSV